MSNGNNPAYPVAEDHKIADELAWTAGLTKRERYAMAAMQALITTDTRWDNPPNSVSARAVEHADALLDQLEE